MADPPDNEDTKDQKDPKAGSSTPKKSVERSSSWPKNRITKMLSQSLDSGTLVPPNTDDVAAYNKAIASENTHDILADSIDEIDTPYLLISVIGDSPDFPPIQWSKLTFKKAILKLVKRAEECLVMYAQPGPGSIIGTLVEEAFKNHSIKKGKLLRYRYVKSEDDKYPNTKDTGLCLYCHKLKSVCDLRTIKQGHIEDLSTRMYSLENYINQVGKIKIEFINEVNNIPVVLILAEGDMGSVRHVADAVTMGTIVYIIKGSGKAADLIAEYLENDRCNSSANASVKDNMALKENVARNFGLAFLKETKLVQELQDRLNKIVQYKWMITVFDIDHEEPRALADKVSMSVSSLWTLQNKFLDKEDAYCWIPNIYIPLAYRYIQKHNKYDSLKASSLLQQAFDISPYVVKRLLDNGASLRKIYDHGEDSYVYSETVKEKPVRGVLSSKVESGFEDKVNSYRGRLQFLRSHCRKLVGYRTGADIIGIKEDKFQMSEELLSELFMFEFVLQNHVEMADIFWQRCPNQMMTALVLSAFLKKKSKIEMELRKRRFATNLMKMSSTFQQRATFILDKMNIIDEVDETELELDSYDEFATEDVTKNDNYDEEFRILSEPVSVMGLAVTPIEFAFNNERLDFLAHSTCQQYLHTLWTGGYRKAKGKLGKMKILMTAPRTKFWINYVFFLAAIVCVSVFVLTDVKILTSFSDVSYYQMAFTVWILGDFLEEFIVELIEEKWEHRNNQKVQELSLLIRIKNWFSDFWNWLDGGCYLSYGLGVAAHIVTTDPTTVITRRLYTLTTVFMYARFMRVLLMSKNIGTKVIMIAYMMKDLLSFIRILAVVLVGVGVAYHANIYPNFVPLFYSDWGDRWTDARIFNILGMPYWQIYGEPNLEDLESESIAYCQAQNITSECSGMDFSVPLISFIYMMFGNVLLMNLVIAMFSNRYASVESNSERVYNYRLVSIVLEYKTRLPAPVNFLIRPFQIGYKLLCRPKKIDVLEPKKLLTGKEHKYRNVTPHGVDETTTSFQFEVKSEGNVFVGLFAYPPDQYEGEMTEVMISGSDMEKSVLTNRKKDVLVTKDTEDILDKSSYREFQIEWQKVQEYEDSPRIPYIAVYARTYVGNFNRLFELRKKLVMKARCQSSVDNINCVAIYTSDRSEGSWKFGDESEQKWIDVITKDGKEQGLLNVTAPYEASQDYTTERRNGYRFAKFRDIKKGSTSVIFKIRARCDAHLVLFANHERHEDIQLHKLAQDNFEMFKVIIGGAQNTKSWITYTKCQNLADTLLTKDPKEHDYWISWGETETKPGNGTENEQKILKVGTGKNVDMQPFMEVLLDPFPVYFIGVSTSDQSTGSWSLVPGKTIFTPAEFSYQLVTPITLMSAYKVVTFEVKAGSDAHIALCKKIPGRCNGDMFEVVIGGQKNSISFIRNIHVTKHYLRQHEGGKLDPNKYTKFWISWADGRIMVGEGDYCTDKENHFLNYRYNEYSVQYLAISTGPQSKGYWRFQDDITDKGQEEWEKTQLKWKRLQNLLSSVCIHGDDKTLEI